MSETDFVGEGGDKLVAAGGEFVDDGVLQLCHSRMSVIPTRDQTEFLPMYSQTWCYTGSQFAKLADGILACQTDATSIMAKPPRKKSSLEQKDLRFGCTNFTRYPSRVSKIIS